MTETTTFQQVHELTTQLLAVIRSANLYTAHHDSVTAMTDRLYGQLRLFLDTHDTLEIEIDSEGLTWEGRRLGRPNPNQRDIIFRLHTDGVRVMTLFREMDKDSLEHLIATFLIDTTTLTYADHDIATLIWQQDLPGIRFAVVEPFLQFSHASREEEQASLQEDVTEVKDRINTLTPPGKPGNIEEETKQTADELEEIFPARVTLELPDTEEIREGALSDLIKILLVNLKADDPMMVQRAMENLNTLLHLIIQDADLKIINQILNAVQGKDDDLFLPFLEHINNPQTIDQLLDALDNRRDWESRDLATFILHLQPDAVREVILKTLTWQEERSLKRSLDTLESYFKFHEDLLMDLIPYFTPIQWKNLLPLAERMPARHEILTRALNNPSPDVRLTTLKIIETLSPEWINALLWDESEAIRMTTLERIKREGITDVLEDMQVGIMEKNFCEKSTREKEKWFIVAAMVGREALLSFFMNFFGRKTLVDLARSEERTLYAAKALGVIGSREALDLLKREAKRITNTPLLRKACQDAVKNIERKTGGIDGYRGA